MPLPTLVLSALLAGAPSGLATMPGAHSIPAPRDAPVPHLAHDTGAPGQPGTGDTPAASPAGREIAVTLVPGDRPPVVALVAGDDVRLVVQGQPGMVLHLHGYDVETAAGPDGIAVIAIEPHHAGRFPVMTHGEDAVLGTRETAAFYLEITTP